MLTLTSPAFAEGERIPLKYTRDGDNLSPPLRWTGVPEGTRSFVLIMEDPDAPGGTFRHWAAYNIPPDRRSLPESVETQPEGNALRYAANDFGNERYAGAAARPRRPPLPFPAGRPRRAEPQRSRPGGGGPALARGAQARAGDGGAGRNLRTLTRPPAVKSWPVRPQPTQFSSRGPL
jgi:hypothetical protein